MDDVVEGYFKQPGDIETPDSRTPSILKIVETHPTWGCARIGKVLSPPCSGPTAQKILNDAGLTTRQDRIRWLLHRLQENEILTLSPEQAEALAEFEPGILDAPLLAAHPEKLILEIFTPGRSNAFLLIAVIVDLNSGFAFPFSIDKNDDKLRAMQFADKISHHINKYIKIKNHSGNIVLYGNTDLLAAKLRRKYPLFFPMERNITSLRRPQGPSGAAQRLYLACSNVLKDVPPATSKATASVRLTAICLFLYRHNLGLEEKTKFGDEPPFKAAGITLCDFHRFLGIESEPKPDENRREK
ncbi:hypothetical protein [Jeongeupia sp. USM3]|uniref:hypothetical protein n=1 Tax=Jeongeupia sp. USM3 TaxID=1906741 RepID=UPI00143A1B96|nr:hypothetical protein [Jeongeupia sp. USM3]